MQRTISSEARSSAPSTNRAAFWTRLRRHHRPKWRPDSFVGLLVPAITLRVHRGNGRHYSEPQRCVTRLRVRLRDTAPRTDAEAASLLSGRRTRALTICLSSWLTVRGGEVYCWRSYLLLWISAMWLTVA